MTGAQPNRPRHSLLRVAGRFLSGRHLDGRARSDSTFWARAADGEPGWLWSTGSPWARAAGWHRAAARIGLLGALYGLWRARELTEWALTLTGGPVAGLLLWRALRAVRLWRHRRELLGPLSGALAPFLGIPPGAVWPGLSVRPDFEDAGGGEHVGALQLPDFWAATPDQKARVEEVIGARFGMELRWQWRTAAYPMALNWTRAPVPPVLVPLAGLLAELEALPAHRVLLGVAADGTLRHWDTSHEDPHIAIHGGSRRGKTSLLLLIAAQDIRKGAELVMCIDPKRVSLAALAGLPGVELLSDPRDVPAMWQGVARFRQLVEDRYDALAADPTLEFRRALLIIDEVSQFAGMSAAVWRAVKDRQDPALPPVWGDVAAAVWMGAQVRAHVIVAGQRLDYQILGGMLGSFGVRMLAGYQPQDYARLVGVSPFLRSQKPRGRFLLYAGGELDWVQLVKPDDPDGDFTALRDWARGPADLGAAGGQGTGDTRAELAGLPAGAAFLGMSVEAFRKARQRRPVEGERRAPDGRPAWSPETLTAWREARPSVTADAP